MPAFLPPGFELRVRPPGPCRGCGTLVESGDTAGWVCLICRILLPDGPASYRGPVDAGLPPEDVRRYFRCQTERPRTPGPIWLHEWNILEKALEGRVRGFAAQWLRLPLWSPERTPAVLPEDLRAVWTDADAQATGLLPLEVRDGRLLVGFLRLPEPTAADRFVRAMEAAGQALVELRVVDPAVAAEVLIPALYGRAVTAIDVAAPARRGAALEVLTDVEVADLREALRTGRRAVETLIRLALAQGASDIHVEPQGAVTRVRFRVASELRTVARLGADDWAAVSNAARALAGVPGERAVEEQRGALTVRVEPEAREVDVRVSFVPVLVPGGRMRAEKVVFRLLDQRVPDRRPEDIGLAGPAWELMDRAMGWLARGTAGLVVLSGPTGSGKTTTLHVLLRRLPLDRLNVMAVEDPVEIFTPGVTQAGVSPRFGFVEAIRAFMRQDPDVILVGEVRDAETARAVWQAALTGHGVLTTVHADSAPDVFLRWVELLGLLWTAEGGREERALRLLAALIRLVSHQQLRRRPCDLCARPVGLPPPARARGLRRALAGYGCEACRGRGYGGVIPVFEVMAVDGEVRRAAFEAGLSGDPGEEALRRAAAERGLYVSAVDDALWKCAAGWLDARELESIGGPEWAIAPHWD